MFVECPICDARVGAKIVCEFQHTSDEGDQYKYVLLVCPECGIPIFGATELEQTGQNTYDWSRSASRLWPDPPHNLSVDIPHTVLLSLEEAASCYKARSYNACAVMSGRAIEAICLDKLGKEKVTLDQGLKELRDSGVIDKMVFEWGEALRRERNIGAHPSGKHISRTDAKDILAFANTIAEYVYVLSRRYDEYKKRKRK